MTSRSKKKTNPLMRMDKEIRKLSCTINYDGASIREKRSGKSG